LGRYEHGWATLEIIRTTTKNKQNYNRKIGCDVTKSSKEHADDDGIQDDANIVEFSDSGDEVISTLHVSFLCYRIKELQLLMSLNPPPSMLKT